MRRSGMSNTPTRNFSLTPELDTYIRALVAEGRYSNASEVVRAGLRLLMDQQPLKQAPQAVLHQSTTHVRG
jgi:antitoxin ParD1/3/4